MENEDTEITGTRNLSNGRDMYITGIRLTTPLSPQVAVVYPTYPSPLTTSFSECHVCGDSVEEIVIFTFEWVLIKEVRARMHESLLLLFCPSSSFHFCDIIPVKQHLGVEGGGMYGPLYISEQSGSRKFSWWALAFLCSLGAVPTLNGPQSIMSLGRGMQLKRDQSIRREPYPTIDYSLELRSSRKISRHLSITRINYPIS